MFSVKKIKKIVPRCTNLSVYIDRSFHQKAMCRDEMNYWDIPLLKVIRTSV